MQLNEIGVCDIKLNHPVACDPYTQNRNTGAYIIIDRLTNRTVGAGMILSQVNQSNTQQHSEFEIEFNQLVRKHFPHWQALDISALTNK